MGSGEQSGSSGQVKGHLGCFLFPRSPQGDAPPSPGPSRCLSHPLRLGKTKRDKNSITEAV